MSRAGVYPSALRSLRARPYERGERIGHVIVLDEIGESSPQGYVRYRVECEFCGVHSVTDRGALHGAVIACSACGPRWMGFRCSGLGRAMLELFDEAALQRWWCRREAARVAEEIERDLRGGR